MNKSLLLTIALSATTMAASAQTAASEGAMMPESMAKSLSVKAVDAAKTMKANKAETAVGKATLSTARPLASKKAGEETVVLYKPEGTFYSGMGHDGSMMYSPFVMVPPDMPMTWGNYSQGVSSFEWTYGIGDMTTSGGSSDNKSTDTHLEVAYSVNAAYSSVPVLSAGGQTYQMYGTYKGNQYETMVVSGGLPAINTSEGSTTYGVTPQRINLDCGLLSIRATETDTWFGKNPITTQQGIVGYGMMVPKPAAPMYVSNLWLLINPGFEAKAGAEVKVDIHEVVVEGENAYIGDVIATAFANMDDAESMDPSSADAFYVLPFYFMDEDPLTGMTVASDFILDREVYMSISSLMDNSDIARLEFPFATVGALDDETGPIGSMESMMLGESYGYIEVSDGFIPVPNMFEGMALFGSPALFMDVLWNTISFESDEISVSTAGETKNVPFLSPFDLSGLEADVPGSVTLRGYGLDDWFTCELGADNTLDLSIDPLPAGEAGRFGSVGVYSLGASAVLTITQGEAGVDGVEAGAKKVAVVGGNFEVTAEDATYVEVYNVAGQKVAEAALEGATTIAADGLAKGLYVLKFNDNTVVKVMK